MILFIRHFFGIDQFVLQRIELQSTRHISDVVTGKNNPKQCMNCTTRPWIFLKKDDLVTIPPIAEETWRMYMMPAEQQRVMPFLPRVYKSGLHFFGERS